MIGTAQVSRARTCFFSMMVLGTIVATLLTPADASASEFRWKEDKSGRWTDPANWVNVDNDPDGFPNDPEDVVTIATQGIFDRVITIPDRSITIHELILTTPQGYRIEVGPGGTGELVFNGGSTGRALIRTGDNGRLFVLNVDVRLDSPLTVEVAATDVVEMKQIAGAGSVTKKGGGRLSFFDATYLGPTRVEEGRLNLLAGLSPAPIVFGDLEIGDGNGAPDSAIVEVSQPHAIGAPRVEVKGDGFLRFLVSDIITHLIVTGGRVVARDDAEIRMRGLTMTGGLLESIGTGRYELEGDATATSTQGGPALLRGSNTLNLLQAARTFTVLDGPDNVDLEIGLRMIGFAAGGVTKRGPGTLQFAANGANSYPGMTRVQEGRLELNQNGIALVGGLIVGGPSPAEVSLRRNDNIGDNVSVTLLPNGTLSTNSQHDRVNNLGVSSGSRVVVGESSRLMAESITLTGGRISLGNQSRLQVKLIDILGASTLATIDGAGRLLLEGADLALAAGGDPQSTGLRIDAAIGSTGTERLIKRGPAAVQLAGKNTHQGPTIVEEGTLIVTGQQPASPISLAAGTTLAGTGAVGAVTAPSGTLAPGVSPGRLTSGTVTFAAATTFAVEVNGTTAGSGYDQLAVTGTVTLGSAKLALSAGFTPPALGASFTLIDNDGTDPVAGTFAGLPEGSTVPIRGVDLTLSYRGGDGNDVVLAGEPAPPTYFLAEGATGTFFDDDVLIANPNTTAAAVTLTFLKEGGSVVVVPRTIPAQSRVTVHVDEIPGLEDVSASVQVVSDGGLPLIVERSMFWDASYYGGHTANAVAQPETRWTFAEGSQGTFFDTYILIANANAEETTATLTFLREGEPPFVATVPIAPFARKTVSAGDYPEIRDRAFGIVVEATRPVIAERSMYFASQPGRPWAGGHVNTGTVAPSTTWFHAEGATGTYFQTFILLSNPQDTVANVELRFLLSTGEVVTRTKTLAAKQRLTVNPADEGDARLRDAALSTVVQADVPIVSERSMYWSGDAKDYGEGHNSSGVVSTATRWGLAEGRIGGPREFVTYILLANPSATEAQVTITYLRESGAPIVKTYTVPPTSRFNVDVRDVVPELRDSSFGARIEVTNNVPIAVERSVYWNAPGAFWAGGTNALATPLQ
jgi:autotransporter-associated beta strand protein